jgi:ADP-heptose:LPS heptosyltransferase/SAM-dependent methyltransferase
LYRLQAPIDFDPPYKGSLLGYNIDENGIIEVEKNYERHFFKRLNFQDISFSSPKNIQKILVVMQGGLGDTLFATPGIRAADEQRPDVEITVCTWNIGLGVVKDNPHIDKQLFTIPSELAMHYSDFDEVLDFSRVIGYRPEAEYTNAYDIYSSHFEEVLDIEVKDKVPEMFLSSEEKIGARNVLINENVKATDKVIGIIDSSSNPTRSWPYSYSLELAYRLVDEGYKVLMLGNDKHFENRRFFTCPHCGTNQHIDISAPNHLQTIMKCHNCDEVLFVSGDNYTPGLIWTLGRTNIRQAASLVSQCDLVIGPDSGLIHTAGALGVPFLALYGPFHSDLRIRYMPTANVIQSDVSCGPCFSHHFHVKTCPLGGPNPPCMWNINPDEVLDKAINIIENDEKYPVPPIEIDDNTPDKCIVCGYENLRQVFRKDIVEYHECPSCSAIASYNAPDNDFGHYQNRYIEYDEKVKEVLSKNALEDIENIQEFLDKENITILELGVGEAYYMNAMNDEGFNIYGVEASNIGIEKSIEKYGEWLKERLFNLDFKEKDSISQLKDIKPDVIVARNFLEHFKDPHMVWENINEILTDNGLLILSSPSSNILDAWNESEFVNTDIAGKHKFMPSQKALEILCEKHGFIPKIFSALSNNQFYFVAQKE